MRKLLLVCLLAFACILMGCAEKTVKVETATTTTAVTTVATDESVQIHEEALVDDVENWLEEQED